MRYGAIGIKAKAKIIFVCRGCQLWHEQGKSPAQCMKCGRMDFDRFDSKSEAVRWAQLLLLEKIGKITKLKRQVWYDLLAYGPAGEPIVVARYVADFVYLRDGVEVREDCKPKAGPDRLADLKLKWMAGMGLPISIVTGT